MTRADFHKMLDEVIEADSGTITGTEKLVDIPKWDSLAVLGFIAAVDRHFGTQVVVDQLIACTTVTDLERLLEGRIKP
jgi:acyl carrier protein